MLHSKQPQLPCLYMPHMRHRQPSAHVYPLQSAVGQGFLRLERMPKTRFSRSSQSMTAATATMTGSRLPASKIVACLEVARRSMSMSDTDSSPSSKK